MLETAEDNRALEGLEDGDVLEMLANNKMLWALAEGALLKALADDGEPELEMLADKIALEADANTRTSRHLMMLPCLRH